MMKNIFNKIYDFFFYDKINTIIESNDLRENTYTRGIITKCYYCDEPVRIDGPGEDFTILKKEYHCMNCIPLYDEDYEDYREDDTKRGNLIECYYCNTTMLIDGDNNSNNDYETPRAEIHCESCTSEAIKHLT